MYSVENILTVPSNLRAAYRYLTKRIHTDGRQYADLTGPNIRSQQLYTVYGIDSIEVIHSRGRNNFSLRAETSDNLKIRKLTGRLKKKLLHSNLLDPN